LLAIAVGQGKVTLETSIIKFLPDSVAENPDLKAITFKDLANHTSGLPMEPANLTNTITDVDQPFGNYQIRDMFSFLKYFKQTIQPGAKFGYSNLGSGLLGVLLERIYQHPYADLVRQYITAPLQMNETVSAIDTAKLKDLAQGYGSGSEPLPFSNLNAMSAAGVLKSSTFDLLTYGKAQLSTADPILDKAIKLTHLTTFSGGSYIVGLGWYYPSQNPNLLQHSGSTYGYRSFICVDLNRQIALVILTNNNTPERVAIIGENLLNAIHDIKTQ
jgi:CubicO group peptidase (beta-lactamase class C family)